MTTLVIYLILNILGFHKIHTLELRSIDVPEVVDFRERVSLSCSYNIRWHILNSVKWYKDGKEFYRYTPLTYPKTIVFDLDGITIADERMNFCNNETCSITLLRLRPSSSGLYRCEVSGDAPEFKLAHGERNMTVGALPLRDPFINGVNSTYVFGDILRANCTSDMSSPPATLQWYINNERVQDKYYRDRKETSIEAEGIKFYQTSLEMWYNTSEKKYNPPTKEWRLKCLAQLPGIPSATKESSRITYVQSSDDLKNQKLTFYRNSTTSISAQFHYILAIFLLVSLVNCCR